MIMYYDSDDDSGNPEAYRAAKGTPRRLFDDSDEE